MNNKLDTLKVWLQGEKYIINEYTEEYENKHLYELGTNQMIDKTIAYINKIISK